MSIVHPEFLLLIPIVLAMFIWELKRKKTPSILYPGSSTLSQLESPKSKGIQRLLLILPSLAMISIIIALSQPQTHEERSRSLSKARDIVLIVDASLSMLAEDLPPNRLSIAKNTVASFIKKRTEDRIALISFGEEVFTQSPLSFDHEELEKRLRQIQIGETGHGTAIGYAIATGINRLKHSQSKSKLIVLLTDGNNTAGQISPIAAANIAREHGIKIYCIGIGKKSQELIPITDPKTGLNAFAHPLDDSQLKEIAEHSNGLYFRAENQQELNAIYDKINDLESSIVLKREQHIAIEKFPNWLRLSLGLLLLSIVARLSIGRELP